MSIVSESWCSQYKTEYTEVGVLKTPTFLITFRRGEKILKVEMLLDTGSDVTVAPRMLADVLGMRLEAGTPIRIYSLDGVSKAYIHSFTFTLRETKSVVPIAISEREDMPFLLGRMGLIGEIDVKLEKEAVCFG